MTPIDQLNPGIRKLVQHLRDNGFFTTDSGDGETHEHECDRPHGYVVVIVPPERIARETLRLKAVLEQAGLKVVPQTLEGPPEGHCTVQAMFCPADGLAVVDVSHVHDRMTNLPPTEAVS